MSALIELKRCFYFLVQSTDIKNCSTVFTANFFFHFPLSSPTSPSSYHSRTVCSYYSWLLWYPFLSSLLLPPVIVLFIYSLSLSIFNFSYEPSHFISSWELIIEVRLKSLRYAAFFLWWRDQEINGTGVYQNQDII